MACDTNSFRANQGTSAWAQGAITWDNGTPLDDEAFTGNINELKDISLTPPEFRYTKIDCIGRSSQTVGANQQTVGSATGVVAGSFQNQAMETNAVGEWKISGTQVVTGDEQFEDILGLSTAQAITGGYSRRGVGALNADGSWDRITVGSFRLYLNNGSEETSIVVSNIYVKLGELKPTGADGHYERTFELMALAKDGAFEWKD